MIPGTTVRLAAAAALAAFAALGCERDTSGLSPVPPDTDPVVFIDDFGRSVDFQAFALSKFDAVSIDTSVRFAGTASLKVTVPGPNDASGFFAGGAFTSARERDLSGYNALTFWARASMTATLNVAGLANDNTGTSRYEAGWDDIPLTTTWAKYVIPIPLPARLSFERGLFFFAEGFENDTGYDIWFDNVMFENVNGISNPRPELIGSPRGVATFVGANVELEARVTFDVDGTDQTINHLPGYFAFTSSDESVATIVDEETIRVVGPGSAVITARLGSVAAVGEVTLTAIDAPTVAAPVPSVAAADVVSIFSDAYSDVIVDNFLAFGNASLTEFSIGNDNVKAYSGLGFAGIEFYRNQAVDVSQMTHFHMDVWVPDGTPRFLVKLVDFGPDGVFGADDTAHELMFTSTSTPALITGSWVSLEIPLTDFVGLTTREHMSQLIVSGMGTAFIDNVYFHK